ncbi:hypothetical protein AB0M20_11660 [Actinoplanes sp. NPDC051633]|uniref:hypothetical protein n=1 Tax=Actinoplanes sp. NPDC051633 TaxID=3155670 RepID=UPI00344878EB
METGTTKSLKTPAPPGARIVATGRLVALACIGFAVVNVAFELTDHFASGPYAEYSAGLSVMNWFVTVLKVVGAAVALLSVARRPRLLPPPLLGVLLWGAFALLAVYGLGSLVQAVGLATGLTGDPDEIGLAAVAYVLFFLLVAAGYGVLAISYARRFQLGKGVVALGVLGAPVALAVILLAVPMLLTALGVMPPT